MLDLIDILLEAIFEEGLLGPILFIFIVVKIFKKQKKKAAKAQQQLGPAVQAPKPEPAKVTQPYAPAQPIVAPAISFGDVPGQVIAPTVHPHVEPDCDTHDIPGSLGETSEEGKDPCHEEQLIHTRQAVEAPAEETAQPLQWSGNNMMKAVIMQEVLTRPCQRRARR